MLALVCDSLSALPGDRATTQPWDPYLGELQMSAAKVETHILVFLLASTQRIIRDSASGDVDKLVPELLDLVKCGKCFRLSGCTVACRFLLTPVYGLHV